VTQIFAIFRKSVQTEHRYASESFVTF